MANWGLTLWFRASAAGPSPRWEEKLEIVRCHRRSSSQSDRLDGEVLHKARCTEPLPRGRWPFLEHLVECFREGCDRALDVLYFVEPEEPEAEGLEALWLVAHQWHASGDL